MALGRKFQAGEWQQKPVSWLKGDGKGFLVFRFKSSDLLLTIDWMTCARQWQEAMAT